ncbi:MAG: Phosphonate-transporting ATPase [Flaviaesturariibacter sp.]|nr:Phosphonate-transporting ATPase [Flaviaesturariibacter sp.]
MTPLIEVARLSKQYKDLKAVNDLSFTVPQGAVYGFLGQNGAGKSTTIRMLLTLIRPTSGSIKLFGKELQTNRHTILSQVGAIIEKPDGYKYLTAYQNLQILAKLSGLKPSQETLMRQLETVGIADRAHSKVKTFSQGMKQRLGIACALIHNPQLVILDEPTNGLDPQGIADIRNLILHLSKNEGKTILISSHLLSEIELIADSMLIIDKGQKVVEGTVGELMNPADTLVELQTADNAATLKALQDSSWATHLQESKEAIVMRLHRDRVPELTRSLIAMNVQVLSIHPRHSLEDYFLSLTRNTHADPAAN